MARRSTSAAKLKTGIGGKLVSAKSKTGDPACSKAMSDWKTSGMTPVIAAILGKCRAAAKALKQAAQHTLAGNTDKAVHWSNRAAKVSPTIAAERSAQAAKIRTERASRATVPQVSPLRQQADAWKAEKRKGYTPKDIEAEANFYKTLPTEARRAIVAEKIFRRTGALTMGPTASAVSAINSGQIALRSNKKMSDRARHSAAQAMSQSADVLRRATKQAQAQSATKATTKQSKTPEQAKADRLARFTETKRYKAVSGQFSDKKGQPDVAKIAKARQEASVILKHARMKKQEDANNRRAERERHQRFVMANANAKRRGEKNANLLKDYLSKGNSVQTPSRTRVVALTKPEHVLGVTETGKLITPEGGKSRKTVAHVTHSEQIFYPARQARAAELIAQRKKDRSKKIVNSFMASLKKKTAFRLSGKAEKPAWKTAEFFDTKTVNQKGRIPLFPDLDLPRGSLRGQRSLFDRG